MSVLRTIAAAALAGATLFAFTAGAQARDDDRWDRKHHRGHGYDRHHGDRHHGHWRDRDRSPRVVYERSPPVIYERQPVYVVPQPMYQPPMYQQPVDSGLNFNFTIPLR